MSKSRISDATWTAFTESIRFVVVPIMLVNLISKNFPSLKTAFMPGLETYILVIGGLIVGASTLECANKPGTYKRLLFGLFAVAFVIFWTFVLFGGGVAKYDYGPYNVSFDMSKILYIVMAGLSLKGLLVIQTFSSNRHQVAKEQALLAEQAVERPAARRRAAAWTPQFEALTKAPFRVTGDDEVGYEPPAQREPVQQWKECPVCGVKASLKETTCKHCGAWFSDPYRRS